MQALQATVDRFDGAAAAALGVHRTDLQCLEILVTRGPATAGALAAALDLTTGGVTAMLVRLERQGHLTRAPDPADGRRVIVQVAPDSRDRLWELYEPIATEGADLIACYS